MSNADLAEIPILKGVQPALLELLTDGIRAFKPGESLISRGDAPKHVLLIRSGDVAVRVRGVHLVTRGRDEIIGEQAFINNKPHSADCVAISPVQAICMSADVARAFLQDPVFVQNLLEDISEKLRRSTGERYVRFSTEQRLFAEFRSHLSNEVLEQLLNRGEDYGAPRHVENVAVLFSDLRGFTAYVHEAGPQKTIAVAEELSAYLGAVTDLIHHKHGFVDKFIGDAVMAFWGYPGIERPHNDEVLACAEDMMAVANRHVFGGEPGKIGVGINQGSCFMGNIGSAEKRQFTILGNPVNTASRFEAMTKTLGDVVIGEMFFRDLSPEQQKRFTPHTDNVRGAGSQTFYSLNNEV